MHKHFIKRKSTDKIKLDKMELYTLYGFKIYIIQSLHPGDLKTGYNLHEELRQLEHEGYCEEFIYNLIDVKSKNDFTSILREIEQETEDNNYVPIIQIECHGNINGLSFTSNEECTWGELFSLLRPINIACYNMLLVNLSCCNGDAIIRDIEPTKRAPFRGAIAHQGVAKPEILQSTWINFYREYLNPELRKGRGICELIWNISPNFIYYNQDIIFEYHYNLAEIRPDIFDSHIKQELIEMSIKEGPLDIDPLFYKERRKKKLNSFYQKHKAHFCFYDIRTKSEEIYEEIKAYE